MDVSASAIDAAREANPDHRFTAISGCGVRRGAVLCYTVLLHVPDDDLATIAARTSRAGRIVIAEIMGRRWRRTGDPPVFNREPEEYVAAFGRTLVHRLDLPYLRYPDARITFLVLG
jgi:hypothetical protein